MVGLAGTLFVSAQPGEAKDHVALFLVLGVYPKPVLDVINPSVERTLSWIGASDPAPTADATPSTPGSEH